MGPLEHANNQELLVGGLDIQLARLEHPRHVKLKITML